jgi:altronate hydrolase
VLAIKTLHIRPEDNVVVALKPLKKGEETIIDNLTLKPVENIPEGHKMAIKPIVMGEKVFKYGYSIGVATKEIGVGEWVHSHNLATGLKGKLEYTYNPQKTLLQKSDEIPSFSGYRRENGKVGIRNEIWIIPTVGCVNKQCEKLALLAREKFKEEIDSGKIEGIHTFSHPYGCSQLGDDHENTQKILAGLVKHPNAGGVLIVGLGCENNQISEFKKFLDTEASAHVRFMIMQEVEDEITAGMELLNELVDYAGSFQREEIPVSELKIGLKCGGSDGFSGITGNPLVGRVADLLTSYGGTSILTEVPEMFGAETILMNRAQDEKVFNQVVELINGFKDYFIRNGQEVYENPSPGNKKGGITTLEEKSLGCTQKGGTGTVVDVLRYGEQIKTKGLNLLEGPGNDIVSTTAMTAAGVHLILFTTGRGTPLGAPVPTIKISTNSMLAKKKAQWIDFDAGRLLSGEKMDNLAEELFAYILQIAGGKRKSRNEENDYRDIAIFKTGVTL